jgi:hypothetical protein
MPIILLITGDTAWTQRAAHLAGALAREFNARGKDTGVLMLRMVCVDHLEYLGAALREAQLPYGEYTALREDVTTIESYGIPAQLEFFEYSDYVGGVLSAAEQSQAAAVFAPMPTAPIPLIANLRLWWLRRRLRCPLYILGEGDKQLAVESGPWTPDTEPAQRAELMSSDLLTNNQ